MLEERGEGRGDEGEGERGGGSWGGDETTLRGGWAVQEVARSLTWMESATGFGKVALEE